MMEVFRACFPAGSIEIQHHIIHWEKWEKKQEELPTLKRVVRRTSLVHYTCQCYVGDETECLRRLKLELKDEPPLFFSGLKITTYPDLQQVQFTGYWAPIPQ
jgi:hypothetical protein